MYERVVERVSDRCDLVEAPARSVVGVSVQFDAESRINVFKAARKLVANGTAPLLAHVMCCPIPGRYIGVAADVQGAGRLRYVLGVQVPPGAQAAAALPEATGACDVPGGLFARIAAHGDQMDAYTYYVGAFRGEAPWVCDPTRLAYHVFGSTGALEWVYEPVREAAGAGPLDAIHWQVVSLPAIRCAGVRRPESAGMQTLFDFFAIEDRVRTLPVAADYAHEYVGFPCPEDPAYGYFGAQVESFEGVPPEFDQVTLPGGEYAHIAMHEMNGDNPMLAYAARDAVLAQVAATHRHDAARVNLFRFHLGTSASVYVPVERLED